MMVMLSLLVSTAHAFDYTFLTEGDSGYYPSTSYEDVYDSQYNYGGPNAVDYQVPELGYGSFSTTQTGVMEKVLLPGLQGSVAADTSGGDYGVGGGAVETLPDTASAPLPDIPAVTELTDSFYLSNGAIGRLSIPSIGVENFYVWEGETTASMAKGVAHFSSTSVWDGNVALCGHNRGAAYVIGAIKDLSEGSVITYTTSQGTRVYQVSTVAKISASDWSYLASTSDNRLTLITCVAGDASQRWCVQAVETP